MRSAVIIGALVGGVALATYPIIIRPYLDPKPWREKQRIGRDGVDVEKIQPGGMKVWTDPFERKKDN
uniref:Small integral membrane protein 20 n=1 Tax=Arion vulgaris TaxID=1028688 RepID=A0A0B6XZJ4_9EUPU